MPELPPAPPLLPGMLMAIAPPPASPPMSGALPMPGALLIPVALAPSPSGVEAAPGVDPPGVEDIPGIAGAPEGDEPTAVPADAPASVVAGSSLPPQPISATAQQSANPEVTQRRNGRN